MPSTHRCYAYRCSVLVPEDRPLCVKHRKMLPPVSRKRLAEAYAAAARPSAKPEIRDEVVAAVSEAQGLLSAAEHGDDPGLPGGAEVAPERAKALFEKIVELAPVLAPHPAVVMDLVAVLLAEIGRHLKRLEDSFTAAGGFDENLSFAWMLMGALATACENHAEGDNRLGLYRAGCAVGELWTEGANAALQEALDKRSENPA